MFDSKEVYRRASSDVDENQRKNFIIPILFLAQAPGGHAGPAFAIKLKPESKAKQTMPRFLKPQF
eukprot:6197267-Pleurochrysis_carterae.AAC.2